MLEDIKVKNINVILCFGLILALSGCTIPKKAELTSASPDKAVAEVVQMLKEATSSQLDLLASEQYSNGKEYVEKAEKSLKESGNGEAVLESAAIAKAYFQEANKIAEPKLTFDKRILYSRNGAIQAGLKNSKPLVEELKNVDNDLSGISNQFTNALNQANFTIFHKKYLALEVKAVQFRELKNIRLSLQQAADNDADEYAPNTLKSAVMDLKSAEDIIAQKPHNPEFYKEGLQKSIDSTVLLSDVMGVILNAEGTPENIALKIVQQNRELGKLNKNVDQLETNLKTTKSNLNEKQNLIDKHMSALMAQEGLLMEKETALKAQQDTLEQQQYTLQQQENVLKEKDNVLKLQNEQLQRASTQVRFQKAMDEAREQLDESDALAYQQGTNLVFRLKSINFESEAATIPEESLPLLSKVNAIIQKLDAELVVVEGHTDSLGSDDFNQELSAKRATSVASYLSSLESSYNIEDIGYGETKPIASNEAESGRAINRRVDLVVTAKK